MFASEEKLYSPFLSLLRVCAFGNAIRHDCSCSCTSTQSRVDEEVEACRKENNDLIKGSCQAQVYITIHVYYSCTFLNCDCTQVMELVSNFRHSTSSSKLQLPLKDSELDTRWVCADHSTVIE